MELSAYGTVVRSIAEDHSARILSYSRNLRSMRDYARRSPVVCVISRKDPENETRGVLHIVYANGAICRASFASHSIMIDFVRNRRSWRGAELRHLSGHMGYLTMPGYIAGGVR